MIKLDFPFHAPLNTWMNVLIWMQKPPPWMNKKLDSHPSERVD
jgi:hypothetical protein